MWQDVFRNQSDFVDVSIFCYVFSGKIWQNTATESYFMWKMASKILLSKNIVFFHSDLWRQLLDIFNYIWKQKTVELNGTAIVLLHFCGKKFWELVLRNCTLSSHVLKVVQSMNHIEVLSVYSREFKRFYALDQLH